MFDNEFQIGDTVVVVDEPYEACPFTWASGMDQFLSRTAIITEKFYSDHRNTFAYNINIDPYGYLWCKNCFVPKLLPEFDVAENEDIVSFLGV